MASKFWYLHYGTHGISHINKFCTMKLNSSWFSVKVQLLYSRLHIKTFISMTYKNHCILFLLCITLICLVNPCTVIFIIVKCIGQTWMVRRPRSNVPTPTEVADQYWLTVILWYPLLLRLMSQVSWRPAILISVIHFTASLNRPCNTQRES